MHLDKIRKFLPNYENISKEYFLNLLQWSNVGFDIYKLEKDFILTLILIKFGEKYSDLIFKGGTCLNKIYFEYFRLSEDLDFVLNIEGGREKRRKIMKDLEIEIADDLNILGLKSQEGRTKFDEHKLAMFTFSYQSIIDNSIQTIKIDISSKHNLILKPEKREIKTIFYDKIFEKTVFDKHFINCIDLSEALAEKIRASLTRNPSAIRDFFDIWYVKNFTNFDFEDDEFKSLVTEKLRETNFDYHFEDNLEFLRSQIKSDLIPVLNGKYDFELDEIYEFLVNFKV